MPPRSCTGEHSAFSRTRLGRCTAPATSCAGTRGDGSTGPGRSRTDGPVRVSRPEATLSTEGRSSSEPARSVPSCSVTIDASDGGFVATQDVFSAEELARLRGFPEINRTELVRYLTLTGADEAFVRQFRTGRNVLGVAVQLCMLPWLGSVPDEVAGAPASVAGRLSRRLGIAMVGCAGTASGSRPAAATPAAPPPPAVRSTRRARPSRPRPGLNLVRFVSSAYARMTSGCSASPIQAREGDYRGVP